MAFIRLTIILLAFFLGIITEYFFVTTAHSSHFPEFFETRKSFGYPMINQLIDVELPEKSPENDRLTSFRKDVDKAINRNINSGRIAAASVYFRDLDKGAWFSLGSVEQFEPASLMKVPIMIALLRDAEKDPGILRRKVKFAVPEDLYAYQRIKPPTLMERGKSYSVDDLLFRMVAYSDNDATYLLEEVVNPATREEVFADMKINSPYINPNKEMYISAEEYAAFFRILYNATYLNKDMSEKALEYLDHSTYKDGLVAGVPPNMVVAHKFGERSDERDPQIKYLSDCGIVYYPLHPYLLCLMTRGTDFDALSGVLQDISRTVYDEVNKHYQ